MARTCLSEHKLTIPRPGTPGKGDVEVRLPWATFGHCLGFLWSQLTLDNAVGSTVQGGHGPEKAYLSPGPGHMWLGTNGGEELQVVLHDLLSKDPFAIARTLVPLEKKIPALFESSPKELKSLPPAHCRSPSP